MSNWRKRQAVARSVSIWDLYVEDYGQITGRMIPCPFHHDTNPSAKFYNDEDGIVRLHCHGCKKQFTSFEYIRDVRGRDPFTYPGVDLSQWEEQEEREPQDFTVLDRFKTGEMTLDEALRFILEV